MHFSILKIRLWLYFYETPHYEVRRLLDRVAYCDLSVNDAALNRDPPLLRGYNDKAFAQPVIQSSDS